MTMLDDDRLRTLFGEAGSSFVVPPAGAADILARAEAPALGIADEEGGDARSDPSGDEADPAEPGAAPGHVEPGGARPGPVRRLTVTARRHPVLSAAAFLVAVLVVAGTIGAVVRASSPAPVLTSGLPHGPTAPSQRVPTTIANGARHPATASPKASGAPAFGAQGGAGTSGSAGLR